jgi:hypothetical protein
MVLDAIEDTQHTQSTEYEGHGPTERGESSSPRAGKLQHSEINVGTSLEG